MSRGWRRMRRATHGSRAGVSTVVRHCCTAIDRPTTRAWARSRLARPQPRTLSVRVYESPGGVPTAWHESDRGRLAASRRTAARGCDTIRTRCCLSTCCSRSWRASTGSCTPTVTPTRSKVGLSSASSTVPTTAATAVGVLLQISRAERPEVVATINYAFEPSCSIRARQAEPHHSLAHYPTRRSAGG